MRTLILGLIGATALAGTSVANAATTVNPSSFYSSSGTLTVDTTDPNNLAILTTNAAAGPVTSAFDFTVDSPETAAFSLTTTNGIITLLNLTGGTVIDSVMGSSFAALLNSSVLTPGNTYRFAYTANLTTAGNVGGTATFSPAAVPEPATWALMLLGFGGIGMAMRRRRSPVLAQVA